MSTTTITHLVFDLDETLYLPETGLLRAIDKRIELFLQEKLGLEMPAVTVLRREYYQKYGTTLRGVRERYGIDPDEYFHYAYLTGVEEFLTPDPLLRRMLEEIPLSKVIFSNSPMEHIARVLKVLGVDHCFQRVFDIRFSGYLGKPNPFSYRLLLEALAAGAENCLFFDDNPVKLETAKNMGFWTVLVNKEKKGPADFWIPDIHQLPAIWREISEGKRAYALPRRVWGKE